MMEIFDNLLKTAIIGSLGICILLFLKEYVFKKFSKKFNYYIWLIIIFRMLLFPFNYSISYEADVSKGNSLGGNISKIYANTDKNIMMYLCYLWIIVTIIIAICTFVKYIKFKNLVVDLSYEVEDDDIHCMYENLLKELNIKKKITLKCSDELISPAGMGLFKSYIFLPEYPYSKEELNWILRHELVHFKNKDILIKFAVLSLKIIYWFNPLVYIMSDKINADCELCCDESVLFDCSFQDKKEYALALIKSIKLSKDYSIGILTTDFNKTNIDKRFDSIIRSKGKSGILLALVLCLLSSTTFIDFKEFSFDNSAYFGLGETINDAKTNLKDILRISADVRVDD